MKTNLLKQTKTYMLGGALGLATVLGGCDDKGPTYETGVITHKEIVKSEELMQSNNALMVDIDGDKLFDRVILFAPGSVIFYDYAQVGDSIKIMNNHKNTELYVSDKYPDTYGNNGRVMSINGRYFGDIQKINTLNEYRVAAGQQKAR